MTDDRDTNSLDATPNGVSSRSTEIGFRPDQLVTCGNCGKPNPPTRGACLYCGAAIEGVDIARLGTREPESWENGFNVVVINHGDTDIGPAVAQLAPLLRVEKQKLRDLLNSALLPLARVESREQAELLVSKLEEFEIKTAIVTDESFDVATPPARLRSVSFADGELRVELFGFADRVAMKPDDVTLIVRGAILETRTEVIEKRKLFRKKPSRESSTSSDEPVIDIYSKSFPKGLRIPANGFDFSGLGSAKSLTVGENMKTLVTKLLECCPSARLDDDYIKSRSFLEWVWPSEATRNNDQLSPNRKEISNVSTTNNATQFTKYSRLRRHLYEKEV